jgi:hypothetical protein
MKKAAKAEANAALYFQIQCCVLFALLGGFLLFLLSLLLHSVAPLSLRFPRLARGFSARAGGAGHVLLMHDISGARRRSQEKSCALGKKVRRGKR